MAQHNDLGTLGEQKAAEFLIYNGYYILEKNWRYKKAEIDIIAKKNELLVCVEVKTRSSTVIGQPEDFVTAKKIKLLTEAINQYIIEKNIDLEIRFDIISINIDNEKFIINHIKNAFYYF